MPPLGTALPLAERSSSWPLIGLSPAPAVCGSRVLYCDWSGALSLSYARYLLAGAACPSGRGLFCSLVSGSAGRAVGAAPGVTNCHCLTLHLRRGVHFPNCPFASEAVNQAGEVAPRCYGDRGNRALLLPFPSGWLSCPFISLFLLHWAILLSVTARGGNQPAAQ